MQCKTLVVKFGLSYNVFPKMNGLRTLYMRTCKTYVGCALWPLHVVAMLYENMNCWIIF